MFRDDTYKFIAIYMKRLEFSAGNKLMMKVHPERFLFKTRYTSPYRILRIDVNVYEVNIPRDLDISPVFDGEDLTQ